MWSLLFMLTFVRLNPKLKKNCKSGQGQHTGYALFIFIIGSISIGGFALLPVLWH